MTVKLVAEVDASPAFRVLENATPNEQTRIVHRALRRAAFLIQTDAARNQIQRGGSGPPNPPPGPLISRTGTLRRSIRVDDSGLPAFVDVGTDLDYGAAHELGIAPMPARPFLQPALEVVEPRIQGIVEAEWNKSVERSGGS